MNLKHLEGLYLQMELSTVKIMACEWAKHNTSKFFITHTFFLKAWVADNWSQMLEEYTQQLQIFVESYRLYSPWHAVAW